MRYIRTVQFKEDAAALPPEIREKLPKAFKLFQENPRHPSLQTNKIRGAKTRNQEDIWEGRVDQDYRFTFHYGKDENGEAAVIFRRVGPHSIIDTDRA
jgi:hypothetical protein